MKWLVKKSTLAGTLSAPPSKSHTIRALLVASLADGVSTIRNPLLHGDGESAIGAARALGAEITVLKDYITVKGTGKNRDAGLDSVWCGNSGTSTNLFTAAAALGSRSRTFDGDASLRSRPVKPLIAALRKLGARCEFKSKKADLPFTISGPLKAGETSVNGVSSQYVSSLLFSCPLIAGNTTFSVFDPRETPYIDLTLWWLKRCGIQATASVDYTKFSVSGGQTYMPIDMDVPADFSGATFAAVAALLTKTKLTLTGLDFSDPQGDKGVFDILEQMGATVERAAKTVVVDATNTELKSIDIDLNAMPDALPAIAVLATQLPGVTQILNVAQARIKETDRIAVMTRVLRALGASVEEQADGMTIHPSKLSGAVVNGHHDHRVVMALALAGMVAQGETVIETAEAAEVTYPTFVVDFKALGADITIIE